MRYILGLLFWTACAEPIDVPSEDGNMTAAPDITGAAPAAANGSNSQTPSTDASAGFGEVNLGAAPPTMGTFAGDLPDSEVKPRFTQEELADAATIKGVINCTGCTGNILIRILPPPPMEPEVTTTADGMQLVTQATVSEPGDFAVKVPDKSPYVIQVVDDVNKDGLPSQGERMGMREDGPVYVDGLLEGVVLTVGVFPQKEPVSGLGAIPNPPAPGEEGMQMAPGEGPPGAEGAPTPPTEGTVPAEGTVPSEGTVPPEGGSLPTDAPPAEAPPAAAPEADVGPPADE